MPRLVLVHGTRMNADQWRPYVPLLEGMEVISVDLPGHGRRVREEFTTEGAVATIQDAVESRPTGQPVVVAGHSLGGYMAGAYAHQHPEDLDALVLMGASADPSGPLAGVYRSFAKLLPLVGHERMARGVNLMMRGLGTRGEHAELLPDGSAYAALPAAWDAVMLGCGPWQLREVACPVWLVNGQLDQMRLHVRRYAHECREPHVVTIPRATHLLPATHPRQLAEVLILAVEEAVAKGVSKGPADDG